MHSKDRRREADPFYPEELYPRGRGSLQNSPLPSYVVSAIWIPLSVASAVLKGYFGTFELIHSDHSWLIFFMASVDLLSFIVIPAVLLSAWSLRHAGYISAREFGIVVLLNLVSIVPQALACMSEASRYH